MTPAVAGSAASVLDAVRVGTLELDHRLVMPPHGGGRGSLLGSPEQFEKHGGRRRRLDGVDSVVLACGSVADDTLHRTLRGHHPGLHVLGDAYAPRRVSFATRQAWALARELDDTLRDGTPR